MQIGTVLRNYKALEGIAGKKLPVKISYAIAVNLNRLANEYGIAEKQRLKLVEGYAMKDENGKPEIENGSYKIPAADQERLAEEVEALMATEADVRVMTIRPEMLDACDDPRYDALSAADMIALDFMIKTEGKDDAEDPEHS